MLIAESLAAAVLERALRCGADYAEVFAEDTESRQLELTNGRLEKANYVRTCGAGVRVLLGNRSAYAYTAGLEEGALLETAAAAAAALAGPGTGALRPFCAARYAVPQTVPFSGVDNGRRAALLTEAARAAGEVSPEITQVIAGYADKVRRVMIATSEGRLVLSEQPRTRAYVRAVATGNGQAQTGFEGPGCCMGFEAYRETIDLVSAGQSAAKTAATMLHAPECPAGYVPVVIDGGFGGVIFHEACGHSLEATCVSKGNSEFCGKLGQKVADERVTAVDDGTLESQWGSIPVDDEGTPARRNLLIERGVLKGYLIDRLGGRRMDMPVTGSARRQSYAFAPTSRMTNTFLCAGSDEDGEMIASLGEGLYAKRMGGGSVNPATGEFNFSVGEGYWVKNGRIVSPVRGATLVGRGTEVISRIDRVGKNVTLAQGMCGSVSGSVPVNVGQPRIRVSGLTVGGRGGAL